MQPPRWLATAVVVALAAPDAPRARRRRRAAEPERPLLARPAATPAARPASASTTPTATALRWFGDYRGAVPGEAPTFCIDLRFWYPNAAYRYRAAREPGAAQPRRRGGLDGAPAADGVRDVDLRAQPEPARSRPRSCSTCTRLMGDGAPGEVDPAALGPDVVALVRPHRPRRRPLPRPLPGRDRPADEAAGGAAGDGPRSACSPRPAAPSPTCA